MMVSNDKARISDLSRMSHAGVRVRPGTARERKAQCALLLVCARLLSFDLVYACAPCLYFARDLVICSCSCSCYLLSLLLLLLLLLLALVICSCYLLLLFAVARSTLLVQVDLNSSSVSFCCKRHTARTRQIKNVATPALLARRRKVSK